MLLQESTPDENAKYVVAHLFLLCCVVTQATIWIQLSHVSHQKYQPFGKILTFNLVAMLVSIIVIAISDEINVKTRMNGVIILGVTVLFQWLFIFRVIYEITHYLNIRVFRTKQSVEREQPPLRLVKFDKKI